MCHLFLFGVSRSTEICEPGGGFDHGSFWQQQGPLREGGGSSEPLFFSFSERLWLVLTPPHPTLGPQMRLGSSSRSPTIVGLVLEHLCPAVQNILEDGLRDHKLDLIIGQRRNQSWGVVEASATSGNPAPRFVPFFSFVAECLSCQVPAFFWPPTWCRSVHQSPAEPGVQDQTVSAAEQQLHEAESLCHGTPQVSTLTHTLA